MSGYLDDRWAARPVVTRHQHQMSRHSYSVGNREGRCCAEALGVPNARQDWSGLSSRAGTYRMGGDAPLIRSICATSFNLPLVRRLTGGGLNRSPLFYGAFNGRRHVLFDLDHHACKHPIQSAESHSQKPLHEALALAEKIQARKAALK